AEWRCAGAAGQASRLREHRPATRSRRRDDSISLATALLWWRRGRTDHELGKQLDDRCRARTLLDLGEQDLGPAPAGLEELLADGRQPDVVGCLDVVVADDREILGHVQAGLVGRGDDPEGLGV